MSNKSTALAWGYWSKEKGTYPESFKSRTIARNYKDEAEAFFSGYKFKLVQVQVKPYVKK